MTTAASAATSSTCHLPTGGCNYNFPNLGGTSVCGCQKFMLKKRSQKRVNRWSGGGGRGPTGSGTGRSGTSEDSEDDEDACRCGHDSCYHSGHPAVPTHAPAPALAPTATDNYLSPQLREPLELQRAIGYGGSLGSARERSLGAHRVGEGLMVRADGSANVNMTALSAVSGTTTERDSSTSGTPMGLLKIPWTTKYAAPSTRVRDEASKQLTDQLHNVVSHGMAERLCMNPKALDRPPSSSSSVKERLKNLVDCTAAIETDQINMRQRVEMMEVMPATLEDLAEKVDLIDDQVNEKLDNTEVRLMNEIDDRLGPIESFLRAQQAYGEKRKRRHQAKANLEICDNSGSIHSGGASGGKRRKRPEERDASEVLNSQQHGITTTSFTTTSFTTTTSSFGSPGPSRISQHADPKVLSDIEMLKARLSDIEASAPPSVARPWIIEVVLIPPASLSGIWAEAQASVPNTQYTGSENASASAPTIGKALCSPQSGLVPFSFSVKSKVYKRLHSRGFVKRLHITGPTAREVSLSIESNFQNALEFCASYNVSRGSSRSMSQQLRFQASDQCHLSSSSQRTAARGGTRSLWEPLRKIYKQAPLEFLQPSDITTPALWTVDFLKANCIMRGTTRKTLYVLPRTSSSRPSASIITWEAIKQLDRYYDSDETECEQATMDAEESFWRFDAKLDSKRSPDPDPDLDPDMDLHHTANSFFSEPFASFGPFAPESVGPAPARISFSSHLAVSPPLQLLQQQEATPPETVPQLQPRRSSKLNRMHTSPLPPPAAPLVDEKEVATEDDAERKPSPPRKKRSPRGGSSTAALTSRATQSPPSPPLTYPQGVQRRKKKTAAKDPESSPNVRRSRTVEGTLSPLVARSSGSENALKESSLSFSARRSPTVEGSPFPLTADCSGNSAFGRSFEEFMTLRTGRWQDYGSDSGALHRGWDQVEGLAESSRYEFGFSDIETSINWGSLFGSPDTTNVVSEAAADRTSELVGKEEDADADEEQTQEDHVQHAQPEEEGDDARTQEDYERQSAEEGDDGQTQEDHAPPSGQDGEHGDGEEDNQEESDENNAPQFHGPPIPIPLGISLADCEGDGGYYSNA
ncbi:hypothetical protein BZA05DRAFT_5407 [Tricharina praecox]|uniref:uncharacterized protein n=1 Tax=Tricharina praecox TaxID=43433 RepID=UPI00221E6750|nr:uncharacterized protein BZA05DRAFT_5407 [Tricharina praecox]KAI5858494.1 hypothetical protein BZA05DRAFT_5407 [Tricharina praecox]